VPFVGWVIRVPRVTCCHPIGEAMDTHDHMRVSRHSGGPAPAKNKATEVDPACGMKVDPATSKHGFDPMTGRPITSVLRVARRS
jgi:hypothetical protein